MSIDRSMAVNARAQLNGLHGNGLLVLRILHAKNSNNNNKLTGGIPVVVVSEDSPTHTHTRRATAINVARVFANLKCN